MTKRIILTTMSTLPFDPKKNFYRTTDQKYCEGISQLEAGTKYYLSTVEDIKEIVAIGSDKVIEPSKDLLTKVCLKDQFKNRNVVQEIVNKQNASAYSMYSYGIHCFLNEEMEPSTIQIDEARQIKINKIIEENQSNNLDERMKKINEAIKADIEKAYLTDEEKEAYRLGELPEFDVESKEIEPYINTVKKERSISLFGKEIIFVRLLDEIQNKVLDMTSKKDDVVSKELLKKYQEDLQKLTIELEDIRTHRFATEKQYAKEKIFEKMDSDSKLKCREENKTVEIQFVPLKKEDEIDNIQGLLNAIQKDHEPIEIYLDMQGGSRTDGYIRSAVLSLLNNDESSNVKLKKVIACDFEYGKFFNPIKNETNRYKITDLVSGMNAFLNYGKAEQLNQTWKELSQDDQDDAVQDIIDLMRKVDQSLSLCDVDALAEGIRQLYKKLSDEIKVTNSNEEFMEVLRTNILEDYKGIVKNGEIDIFALVQWANKKGFIQQAITLIESRMPEQMVKDGYLSYCPDVDSIPKVAKRIDKIMSSPNIPKYELDNIDHLMVHQAAHGYKSNKKNKKGPSFIEVYAGDEHAVEAYAYVWNRRNEANHAGENSLPYKDTIELVNNFIQSYEGFRDLLEKEGNPLPCVRLLKKDVKPYFTNKKQDDKKKNKTKEPENKTEDKRSLNPCDYYEILYESKSPNTYYVNANGKRSRKVNNVIKRQADEIEKSIQECLGVNFDDLKSRIYNDENKSYLNRLKNKSKSTENKELGCFVIPKVMYDKDKKFFQSEIVDRNHKLIVIDTKCNPMKIVK